MASTKRSVSTASKNKPLRRRKAASRKDYSLPSKRTTHCWINSTAMAYAASGSGMTSKKVSTKPIALKAGRDRLNETYNTLLSKSFENVRACLITPYTTVPAAFSRSGVAAGIRPVSTDHAAPGRVQRSSVGWVVRAPDPGRYLPRACDP